MMDFNATESVIIRADEIIPGDWVNWADTVGADSWNQVTNVRYIDVDEPNHDDRVEIRIPVSAVRFSSSKEYRASWMVRIRRSA